jgi:hypothetical protein
MAFAAEARLRKYSRGGLTSVAHFIRGQARDLVVLPGKFPCKALNLLPELAQNAPHEAGFCKIPGLALRTRLDGIFREPHRFDALAALEYGRPLVAKRSRTFRGVDA